MKRTTRILLICFFALVLAFSLWKLWGIFSAYQEGDSQYEELEHYVTVAETESVAKDVVTWPTVSLEHDVPTEPPVDISQWPQVDFEQLSKINSDIVGWIYIEGTHINYPVVQAENNRYYLNRLFNKGINAAGCIFLDYRSSSDFYDRNSIIYGHHMRNKTMFADITKYKKQEFYEEHPYALLVTPTAYYKIEFFSGYVSSTSGNAWDMEFDEEAFTSWLDDLQSKSSFVPSSTPSSADRIITLSTCTYEFNSAKFVLHGYISEYVEKPMTDE